MNLTDELKQYREMLEAKTDPELIEKEKNETYGQECILDVHGVPDDFFRDKKVRHFAEKLCEEIGMTRGPIYLWGNDKSLGTMHDPKADGISVCQFLHSSSITIHSIDEFNKVFINVFSCKNFDIEKVRKFTEENVGGTIVSLHNIKRK